MYKSIYFDVKQEETVKIRVCDKKRMIENIKVFEKKIKDFIITQFTRRVSLAVCASVEEAIQAHSKERILKKFSKFSNSVLFSSCVSVSLGPLARFAPHFLVQLTYSCVHLCHQYVRIKSH